MKTTEDSIFDSDRHERQNFEEEPLEEEELSGAKRNILLAASEVFAEQGFFRGTTREISGRASVNFAAINYYFGNKEQLYFSVLSYWKKTLLKKYPIDAINDSELPADSRLRLFIRMMLCMLMDKESPPWLGKLFTREVVIESTNAFESIVKDEIKMVFGSLYDIVAELLEDSAPRERVQLCTVSILGQCVFFYTSRPVFRSVYLAEQRIDMDNIDVLVEHVYQFSMSAILAYGPAP